MAKGDTIKTTDYAASKSKATSALTKVGTTFTWTTTLNIGDIIRTTAITEIVTAVDKAYDLLVPGTTQPGCSHNSAHRNGYSAGGSYDSSNYYDSCDYCYWCSSNNGLS
jgi:hypothetical protein